MLTRGSMSGRARLGCTVDSQSTSFNILVAIESCIYEMIIDPNVSSRPVPCELTKEDYALVQTVIDLYVCMLCACICVLCEPAEEGYAFDSDGA